MTSLRVRLFSMIVATTVLVWLIAAAWVYVHTRAEVQRVLDRRLVEAATMVSSLARSSDILAASDRARLIPLPRYSRQLSCQIWSLNGQLVARSSGAPAEPLAVRGDGMSERDIGGETWRVFTVTDPGRNIRISVGDSLGVRQRLIRDLMLGLLLPAIAGLAVLSFLIWASVGKGLAPLRLISDALRRRDPADFSALGLERPTREILPLVQAIDDRSRQLKQVREAEHHFIASAAHELQTPLAGLKTHAQVATRTDDPTILKQSLANISQSVDRTSRLVNQLLDLARAEGQEAARPTKVNLGDIGRALQAEFAHVLAASQITLELGDELEMTVLLVAETELMLALKNLVSNAINHSPRNGKVRISLVARGERIGLAVTDDGPGIDPSEIERVRERFVRGVEARGHGTGLGLSVVDLVAARVGGELELANGPERGLTATLWLPPRDQGGCV